jgi:hypothetical protein
MERPFHLVIDEDDGEAEGIDVGDQLLAHLPGDDDAVDVPLEKKPGHVLIRVKLIPHSRKEDIEVMDAGLEFGPEENARVKRLRLGEMFFGEDETDVPARFGGQAAR